MRSLNCDYPLAMAAKGLLAELSTVSLTSAPSYVGWKAAGTADNPDREKRKRGAYFNKGKSELIKCIPMSSR